MNLADFTAHNTTPLSRKRLKVGERELILVEQSVESERSTKIKNHYALAKDDFRIDLNIETTADNIISADVVMYRELNLIEEKS